MTIPNIQSTPLTHRHVHRVTFDGDRSVWAAGAYQGSSMTTLDWSGDEPRMQTFTWRAEEELRPAPQDLLSLGDGRWVIHTLTGHHDDGGYDMWVMDFDQLPEGDRTATPWRCPRFYSQPVALEGRVVARRTIKGEGIALVEVTPGEGERVVYEPAKVRPSGFTVVPLPDGRRGLYWGGEVFTWEGDRVELTWALGAASQCTCHRMGEPHGHQAIPGPDGSLYLLRNTYSRLQQGGEIFARAPDKNRSTLVSTPTMPRMEGMVPLPDGAFLGVTLERKKYATVWFLAERQSISLTAHALGIPELDVGGVWWSEPSQSLYVHAGKKLLRIAWDDLKGYRRRKMR